jgi:hypothetical protein
MSMLMPRMIGFCQRRPSRSLARITIRGGINRPSKLNALTTRPVLEVQRIQWDKVVDRESGCDTTK